MHHRQEVGSNRRARFVPERANHTPAGSYERGMDVKQSAFTHPPCQKNVKSSPLLPGELPGLERFVYNFMIPQSCLLGGDGSWKTSLRERGLQSNKLSPPQAAARGTSMHYASTMNGVIAITLMFVNTLIWAVPVHILALTKLLIRSESWQRTCARALMNTVNCWIWGILASLRLTQKTRYHIEGLEGLSMREWYFINCNHQSWSDILVLLVTFHGRIPFFKFFLKKELFWIPLLGTAWWALDYPFMRRYSKSFLERNPHLKDRDLETTRKACEKYRHTPVSILNFIEGTRFTPEKHARQNSPYRHLLMPKSGGFAFALAAMDGRITHILDVTIVYPRKRFDFWDYLCGRVSHIHVRVKKLTVPPDILHGDYRNDPVFKERFQAWVRRLWEDKDQLIDRIRESE